MRPRAWRGTTQLARTRFRLVDSGPAACDRFNTARPVVVVVLLLLLLLLVVSMVNQTTTLLSTKQQQNTAKGKTKTVWRGCQDYFGSCENCTFVKIDKQKLNLVAENLNMASARTEGSVEDGSVLMARSEEGGQDGSGDGQHSIDDVGGEAGMSMAVSQQHYTRLESSTPVCCCCVTPACHLDVRARRVQLPLLLQVVAVKEVRMI